MTIFLAILSGLGLGYILERGDFCFHSTIRGIFRQPREMDLARAYVLTLLIATPLIYVMMVLGWIRPYVAPWTWQANIIGGLIFGAGMVVAATCITGFFYKLGHGMLGVLLGIVGWIVGDLLVFNGPLGTLRNSLVADPIMIDGESATLLNSGSAGLAILGIAFVAGAIYLVRCPHEQRGKYWSWIPLGVATALFTSFAWLLARAGNESYTYGTSGVPTSIWFALSDGLQINIWIPIALFSLIPGAVIAAWRADTLWIRGETMKRYGELAAGGLLMGIGSAIAGGCNLGHSLVGVPLLSLGSITSTLAIITGIFVTHHTGRLIATHLKPVTTPAA